MKVINRMTHTKRWPLGITILKMRTKYSLALVKLNSVLVNNNRGRIFHTRDSEVLL